MSKKGTVYVGISGGVDSAVAALRLKKQGYDVVAVFIKVWHPPFMVCNWEAERLDAMRVAAHLDIPFLTCDAVESYKRSVADHFIDEYKAGRTPNPDVLCNSEVKFGAFLEFAKSKNADYIATGHYVQKINDQLHRGVDTSKDQSYFLWKLSQEQLDFSLFPVGDTSKSEIRNEAAEANIPVAKKKDSQGICFLGHIDIKDFLSHYVDLEPGNVLNTDGEIIGEHSGALIYTTGQRHGFVIHNSSANQHPQYVIDRNIDANTITVATSVPRIPNELTIKLTSPVVRGGLADKTYSLQYRYRQEPFVGTIEIQDSTLVIRPADAIEKPASGQSLVIYDKSHCLGGGIVE